MGLFGKNKLSEGSDSKTTTKIENTKNNWREYDLIGFLRKRVGGKCRFTFSLPSM